MVTTLKRSSAIIYIASGLGISISLSAIIWRSYCIGQLRYTVGFWRDRVLTGLAAFLITTLIIHIGLLVSSFSLVLDWGRKMFKPVTYVWIIVTWLSIIIDTAFFWYGTYYLIYAISLLKLPMEYVGTSIPIVPVFYMLLLLIHIIMAYLTIQIGYYASRYTGEGNGYVMGRVLKQKEDDPYMEDEIPHIRQANHVYQNAAFSRSAEDLRFGVGGNSDRHLGSRYKRYTASNEIPADYRRASRYHVDTGRY